MADLGLNTLLIKKKYLFVSIMMAIIMMSGLAAATVIEETNATELIIDGQTAKANSDFIPLVGFNLVTNGSETLNSVKFTLIDAGATGVTNAAFSRASIFYSEDNIFDSNNDTEIGYTGSSSIAIGTITQVTTNTAIPESGSGMHYFIAIKTSASWAEPHAIRINLAEGTSTYLLGDQQGTVFATTLTGENNLTADATLPSITSAETIDSDGDGHIDHYKLTFDAAIVDDTLTGYIDTSTPFTTSVFAVAGYENEMIDPNGPDNDDAADNNILYLSFTESESYDTGVKPDLTVTGSTLEDLAGNTLADVATGDLAEEDLASPVITAQKYTDSGNNGTIDQVVLTFSESISYAAYDDNDWSVTPNSITGLDVSAGTAETSETLTLTASANAGITGGATQPTLAYSGDGVVDAADNQMVADTVTLADDTTPILASRETGDSDSDGQIDMMTLTFSENLNSSALGTFAVDVTGYVGESYYDADNTDNVIVVNFTESGSPDTAAIPEVRITNAGSVTDRATTPNALVAEGGATASTDGAAPVAISRVTGDNDRDGQIDRMVLTFSEALDSSELGAFAVDVDGYNGEDYVDDANDDNIILVTFTQSGSPDTAATPNVQITNAGSITDLAVTPISLEAEDTATAATDGAAPALLTAVAGDGSNDADDKDADDIVVLTFSENTTGYAITGANIDTVLDLGGHSWIVGENPISAVWTSSSVLTVTLGLNTAATVAVGDVITPSSSITDGTNAMGVDTATITGSFDDVTPPELLSATTGDADVNGYIDTMVLVFDESMNGSINSTTGLAIGSFEFNATGVWSVSNTTLTISLNESESYDTNAMPDVTYNATLGSLADASSAGNDLGDVLTDDVTEEDGASPVIVGQEYLDSNYDGTVDQVKLTFSENITYSIFNVNDWSFVAGSITGLAATAAETDNATLILTATADPNITGGAVESTLAYDGNGVVDDAENLLAAVGPLALTDSAAPAIKTATTRDSNGNGKLDNVTIVFTESVSDASLNAANFSIGGVAADAMVTGDTGNDSTVIFTISNDSSQSVDTDSVDVVFTAGSYSDGTNVRTEDQTVTSIDAAAPVITGQEYRDANGDGTVDQVVLTFSEEITYSEYEDVDWTVSAGSITGLDVTAGTATNNATLVLTATANANITGGSEAPTIQYNVAGEVSITDGTNTLASTTTLTLADAAAPVVISRTTGDADFDGYIDMVTLTYSEALDSSELGDFAVAVTGYDGESYYDAVNSDNVIVVNVTESGSYDTDATPEVQVTNAGTVTDRAATPNNIVAEESATQATDGAAPAIVSAVASDESIDGEGIDADDTVVLTFSENITEFEINATNIDGVLDIGESTWLDGAGAIGSANWTSASVLTVTLNVTEGVPTVVVGDVITPNASITDGTNAMGSDSVAITGNFNDVTAPTMLSATTDDADGNGYIDEIAVVFDESMKFSVVSTAGFTIGDYEINATGAWSQTTLANDTFTISLVESDSYDTGATPLVTYNETEGLLTDDASAENALEDVSMTAVDGAAPVVVSRVTAATNFAANRVILTFSEALDSSELGDFAVNVTGYEGEGYIDTDNTDNVIVVNFTAAGSVDTDATPEVQIADAGSVTDRATSPIALVAEGSATAATDGIAPDLNIIDEDTTDGAMTGDTVTIVFSTSETLSSEPIVTLSRYDGGAFVENYDATNVSFDGSNYTYNYEVQGTETEANYWIRLNGTDMASNVGIDSTWYVTFDFTVPDQIEGVTAEDRQDSDSSLNVSWNANDAPDFANYNIYISTSEITNVSGMIPEDTVDDVDTTTTTLWTIDGDDLTDGVDYYVAVAANDTLGNQNDTVVSFGPVKSYADMTLTLEQGWNLVSVPGRLDDSSTEDVFDDRYVFYYDAAASQWDTDPDNIVPCRGYWVYSASADSVNLRFEYMPVDGSVPKIPPTQDLAAGWNMIGHTSADDINVTTSLTSITGSYSNLLKYSGSAGWERYINEELQDFTQMSEGEGYWIFMTEDKTYAAIDNYYENQILV
ncbi:beta strand repeat-containing protein [Methanolobus psychrotolerans]|uniref:beta strand repeat-containing protein n=1 Tax=Methanolobus psychrotolerans TaxID=1874706 RepID=UPI000B91741E|nr:hypothetical protein [Methanolobus psychrotolerans]